MANNNPTPRIAGDTWSEADEKQLRKLYPKTHNEIISDKIPGTTVFSIRAKAVSLGLKKSDRYWDIPEEDFIRKNWDAMSPDELAAGLKEKFQVERTKWAVINKYRELTGKRLQKKK